MLLKEGGKERTTEMDQAKVRSAQELATKSVSLNQASQWKRQSKNLIRCSYVIGAEVVKCQAAVILAMESIGEK